MPLSEHSSWPRNLALLSHLMQVFFLATPPVPSSVPPPPPPPIPSKLPAIPSKYYFINNRLLIGCTTIERFNMTSRHPYLCPKIMKPPRSCARPML